MGGKAPLAMILGMVAKAVWRIEAASGPFSWRRHVCGARRC